MSDDSAAFVDAYLADLARIQDGLRPQMKAVFPQLRAVFEAARDARRTIFTMGNGGSAAAASHLANDVNKYTIASGLPRYRCIALTDATPLLSAWANDASYDDVFVEQLKNFLEPGDVLIGISGSGNSRNCIKALEYARANGATAITWTGYGGGRMAELADLKIVIPSDVMVRCEDAHVIIHHAFVLYLTQSAGQSVGSARRSVG